MLSFELDREQLLANELRASQLIRQRPDHHLARLLAQGGQGDGAAVILISTGAEADYTELIAESPAAGFLAKSELSAQGIGRILGHPV